MPSSRDDESNRNSTKYRRVDIVIDSGTNSVEVSSLGNSKIEPVNQESVYSVGEY